MAAQFPSQRLTEAEKITKYGSVNNWAKEILESVLSFSGHGQSGHRDERYEMKVNYELAAGNFDLDDMAHITTPVGLKGYTYPATARHYDIITTKFNELKGEEIGRPFNFRVTSANDDSQTEKETESDTMLLQSLLIKLKSDLEKKGIPLRSQPAQQKFQETIEKHTSQKYAEKRESMGQDALEHLRREQGLEDKFNDGWGDLMTSNIEVYWTGVNNGEPICRLVNPMYFDYDRNEDIKYIEDSAWAIEWRYMPAPSVHDEYHDVLTDADVKKIEEMKGNVKPEQTAGRIPVEYGGTDTGVQGNSFYSNSNTIVKVIRCEWKSLRKIGFLVWEDEEGKLQEKIVPEDYKVDVTNGEKIIAWEWIDETWEAEKIGDEIIVNARPRPNQHRKMDNPSKCKLGYTGVVHNRRNAVGTSLIGSMKPHQSLYNVVMYNMERTIARAKGKGMIFDLAQLPKSHGIDIPKLMYFMDIGGIMFINSHEEGNKGKTSSFNAWKEYDMTLSNSLQQYIYILDKLEKMVSDISGISPQRQGQVESRDLASTTAAAITQSGFITESLFNAHNEVKKRVLTNLLEDAKLAWINGKKGQYVMPDETPVFFNIEPEIFADTQYNIFISNSTKDAKILALINQLAQVALQQDKAQLSELVKIAQQENIAKASTLLEEGEERAFQRNQANTKAVIEGRSQEDQRESVEKEKDRSLKDKISIREGLVKLEIKKGDGELKREDLVIKNKKIDVDATQKRIEATIKNAQKSQIPAP